jgi:hypothetical protein
MPLLPITLLAPHIPGIAVWAPVAGAFAMLPLLERDGLTGPYLAAGALYVAGERRSRSRSRRNYGSSSSSRSNSGSISSSSNCIFNCSYPSQKGRASLTPSLRLAHSTLQVRPMVVVVVVLTVLSTVANTSCTIVPPCPLVTLHLCRYDQYCQL